MAVQIIGLRDYLNSKTGKTSKKEAFYKKGWGAPSVRELFTNIEEIIQDIPAEDRWNLYYTAAECLEGGRSRVLARQTIIPFDVDGIDTDNIDQYIPVVCDAIGVDPTQVGIVASGNGIQVIVHAAEIIHDEEYFDAHRVYYKAVCGGISQALFQAGLPGSADPSVFSAARLLRLPLTRNVKKDKAEKQATLINGTIEEIRWNLVAASRIPIIEVQDQISQTLLDRLPPPDTEGVLNGCDFIKWCRANSTEVNEPQWYALLSILGRLEGGRELSHLFSKGHGSYDESETDRKLEQAVTTAGPRTCTNIGTIWDGCSGCANYNACKSPITIQSREFIKTKQTGFHDVPLDGNAKPRPNYADLMKHFEQCHPFVTLEEGGIVSLFNGKHWRDTSVKTIEAFAEDHFNPKPITHTCKEFLNKVTRNNLVGSEYFYEHNKINFSNGVLDLEDMSWSTHTPENGFKYVLPFDYNTQAECPRFDQYLEEVTIGDVELQQVLLEFMGYSLSGVDPSVGQKALILTGDGSNGKSVFLDLLKFMAGHGNYSTLSMGYEINKLENRYQLDGKLFNISEETPAKAMMENSVFKALVTGGEVQARKLYCDAYSMKNRAKILMACNDLPVTNDLSKGMFRRLLIAPFRACFENGTEDIHMREKLYAEASGIYNRALAGLMRLKRQRHFSESAVVTQQVNQYAMDNNSVLSWWQDSVTDDDTGFVANSELYRQYRMDCQDAGLMPLNRVHFGRELGKFLRPEQSQRKRVNGALVRGIDGVKLNYAATNV